MHMTETAHYAEYSVIKKYEGKYGRNRILAISLYIICPILLLFIMLFLMGPGAFRWFIPLCPFFLSIIVPLTYNRFFKIEYDYRIAAGEFNIAEVYNNRRRREKLNFRISDAEMIAPYRDSYRQSADRLNYDTRYEAASSMNAEDLYFAVFSDEEDNTVKNIVFFEPTAKMLSLMNFYNRKTVVVKVKY